MRASYACHFLRPRDDILGCIFLKEMTGHVCHGSKLGLAALLVSDPFCKIKRSWRFEGEMYSGYLRNHSGDAVIASDSSKDMEMHEAFISSVIRVLREGRRGGAREFYTSMWSWE